MIDLLCGHHERRRYALAILIALIESRPDAMTGEPDSAVFSKRELADEAVEYATALFDSLEADEAPPK